MNELKPCPFCGKAVATIANCQELEDCANFEQCEDCKYVCVICSFTRGGCGASGAYCVTEDEAMDIWNRRHEPERSATDE